MGKGNKKARELTPVGLIMGLCFKLALAVFIWRRLIRGPGDAARPQAEW
jgi:hypothetical protein